MFSSFAVQFGDVAQLARALAWHARGRGFESHYLHGFCTMFYLYILYSLSTDKYYVGSTENLEDRLKRHNAMRNASTKSGVPWIIKYTEQFETRGEAMKREIEIKNKKRKTYIEWLISKLG